MNKLSFFALVAIALVAAPGCRKKAEPAAPVVVETIERVSGPMQEDAGLEEADFK